MIKTKRTGFALIGVLAALIIIALLYVAAMKTFFSEKQNDEELEATLSREGIDTDNSRAVIESTRKKVEEINQNFQEQQKRIDSIE